MNLSAVQIKTIFALVLIVVVLLIWRALAKRSASGASQIDLDDLLLGDDGKMSKAASVLLGAFAVTSWMMVYLTLREKITEGYFLAYLTAWVAPTVTRLFTNRPTDYAPPPPPAPSQPAPTTIETKTTVTAPGGVTSPGGQT